MIVPLFSLIVVVVLFLACIRWVILQMPGGEGILSGSRGVFGGTMQLVSKLFRVGKTVCGWFDSEKVSGAKFQSEKELSRTLKPSNKGIVLDGIGKLRLSHKESCAHSMLVAPNGAGKSTRFAINNVLTLSEHSQVILDVSGEIYSQTSGALANQGYTIEVFSLENPSQSLGYNPLAHIPTFDHIDEISKLLMNSAGSAKPGGEIWHTEGANLLNILIHVLLGSGEPEWQNLHCLQYLLERFGDKGNGIQNFVSQYADQRTFDRYLGFVSGNERMISTIVTMAKNSLNSISDPTIASLFSRNELDFDRLRSEKTALYIIVPSNKLQQYSSLLTILLTHLLNAQVTDKYRGEKSPYYSLYLLLDEFGHMKFGDSFASHATTLRKYNLSLNIMLQSVSQLYKQYGKEDADTLLEGSFITKMALPGLDITSAERIQSSLGKVKHEYKRGKEKSWHEECLMNADRISRMDDDQLLVTSGNKEPMLIKNTPCYRNPKMAKLMKLSPHPFPSALPSNTLKYMNL